jgi:hypothetical protein
MTHRAAAGSSVLKNRSSQPYLRRPLGARFAASKKWVLNQGFNLEAVAICRIFALSVALSDGPAGYLPPGGAARRLEVVIQFKIHRRNIGL